MKIDKRNYKHWLYLLRSGNYALASLIVRPAKARKKKIVVLYGHKLNGNLRAFADYYQANRVNDFDLYYATLDPDHYRELVSQPQPVPILSLNKFRDMCQVARSSAIITSHGMHTLIAFNKLTNIKFINVWHGIGFKGHPKSDFAFTKGYADNWVSSPTFRQIYRKNFGVTSPIHITGYARSDAAVRGQFSVPELRAKYGIGQKYKKIILIAPTWEQNQKGRSLIPFEESEENFFRTLNRTAKDLDALIIFRTHLNTKKSFNYTYSHTWFMPYTRYPVVEDFLYMADLLVTDWSSIAFDYLPLGRPTIHMDMSNPFVLGFSLDPKHRFGKVVTSLAELSQAMERYIKDPSSFIHDQSAKIKAAIRAGYGDTLDGRSAYRYHQRLLRLLNDR